ncbi:MAG: CRISPR-associated helicase Cas3' [Thermoanaerobaculia bacterium]|nr:CRISPR-associated helicase Cas3' [Thermoanaerobaculia bacterium]
MPPITANSGALRYWAKSDRGGFHPVVYHGLDVAASGLEILKRNPGLERRLERATGLESDPVRQWLSFGLAIHDLGKFADGFQGLDKELSARLLGRTITRDYFPRHDTMGWAIWNELIAPAQLEQLGLVPEWGDARDALRLLTPWLLAFTGHHGRPPETANFAHLVAQQVGSETRRDLLTWLGELRELFLPAGLPFPATAHERKFRQASFLVAGLAVAADWIGSNTEWFGFDAEERTLEEYWKKAQERATVAVAASGLVEARARSVAGFGVLFADKTPTPLQRLADEIALGTGPQLFVIEEVTGSGKTEAALTLAQRLVSAGRAEGLYFALPTMATANAMFARVERLRGSFFSEGEHAPVILAHSKRRLALGLAETKTEVDGEYGDGEPTASRDCANWLARSGKSALSAPIGVGTIDQALLAVLQVRHQSLRLLGLAGKVLVVDEVHACDEYVRSVLRTLLRFHATNGGSALLLSATLPGKQRQELVDAFAAGLAAEARSLACTDYPLLTHFADGVVHEVPVAARAEVSREVAVELVTSEAAVDAELAAVLAVGGCAAWIKNTVTDAIETYRRLVETFGAARVELFHARFCFADRHDIEGRVLKRFGPAGNPEDRRGRILVASQVIEQSVDCDFDLMITDLAPIDLVIQRAGRLQRHRRERPAGFETPRLVVYGPEPIPEPAKDWYSAKFSGGAFVYPDTAALWRTARWLAAQGRFRMPEDARSMIEAVYDPEDATPEALARSEDRTQAASMVDRVLAAQNALKLGQGYQRTSLDWLDDIYIPTRLGDPTVTVRFAVAGPRGLEPFAKNEPFRWEQSEVTLRATKVGEKEDPAWEEALAAARLTMRDEGRYVTVVVLTPMGEGKWRGTTVSPEGKRFELEYDRTEGVTFSSARS